MKKIIHFGMASSALVALVLTLNFTGVIGNTENVKAAEMKTDNEVKVEAKEEIKNNTIVLGDKTEKSDKPQIQVAVNLEVEKADQQNADKGSSPWKLDPVFVSQVFASLKVSPEGIQGDYPIKYTDFKLIKSTDKDALVVVNSNKTDIKKIYLKRLIKLDNTGIWTVVGYDITS
jgi:hypothetical protein